MATTKKPTEATETAEQVQADNSRAEAVKAENEAAEKLTAPSTLPRNTPEQLQKCLRANTARTLCALLLQ